MQKIKFIIAYLNTIRLLPHIFFFYKNFDVCKEDVIVNAKTKIGDRGLFLSFIYLLVFNKYYRNLFYFRIGNVSYFFRFLLPPHPCFEISKTSIIGGGLHCGHSFATVVNADSCGCNLSIYQNVTIGVGGGKRPIIGDNVTIFANSVVIGGITIGDNSQIGAGSVVIRDVPDNCIVAGNPARIIRKNGIKTNIKL